jgi:hypothetical protein
MNTLVGLASVESGLATLRAIAADPDVWDSRIREAARVSRGAGGIRHLTRATRRDGRVLYPEEFERWLHRLDCDDAVEPRRRVALDLSRNALAAAESAYETWLRRVDDDDRLDGGTGGHHD